MTALIEEQEKVWKEQMISGVKTYGKLTLEQAVRIFRESFRKENNILMELTLDDWVWLKSHRTKDGLFRRGHDEQEAQQYLTCIEGIRQDLDIRIIINFFKTIYSMAQNRDTFIDEVFEMNIDLIFECIYNYAAMFDALVIDSIWFCHGTWWVIPGTEDMTEAYHDYAFHWKWFFLGLVSSLPLAVIIGGIEALI